LLHVKSICDELLAVASRPVGADGGVPDPGTVKLQTGLLAIILAIVFPTMRQ
jgi:hypothetical protein